MTDGFNRFSGKEQGIYVVCSDKALLDKINKMLKRQGVLGVTDGEGKLHYMIDGRKNKSSAARQVNEFVHAFKEQMVSVTSDVPESIMEAIIEETIDEAFEFYGFDRTLFGSKVLRYMVRYCLYGGDTESRNLKELYIRAGHDLNMTVQQIERNVRYSIRGSQFGDTGLKTLHIIGALVDAVRVALASKRIGTGK
ncbi:MAG: hypothetical protein MJ108_02990 [Saccharofermentans sp.]|nr:hypothetical protein [Saccharofermentans sp.]